MLFPHLARFSHFCPGVGQFQFASVWHILLQPSPLAVFPSSQFSPWLVSIAALPHNLPVTGGPASRGAGGWVLMMLGPERPRRLNRRLLRLHFRPLPEGRRR